MGIARRYSITTTIRMEIDERDYERFLSDLERVGEEGALAALISAGALIELGSLSHDVIEPATYMDGGRIPL